MKTISNAILMLIAACLMVHGSVFKPSFVPSTAAREALRDVPGEAARLLGEALDGRPTSDNIQKIRRHSVALVREGHAKEVIALLQHPNPVASQGLLEGLLEADCREALPVFLDCLWDLEFYGTMDDGDEGAYRDHIKDHMKAELARMLDLKVDPAWNRREFFERISERAGVPVSAERQAAMEEVCPVGSGGGKPPAPPPVLPGADEVAAPQRSLALWIFSAATVVGGGAVWWWWRRRRNAGAAF